MICIVKGPRRKLLTVISLGLAVCTVTYRKYVSKISVRMGKKEPERSVSERRRREARRRGSSGSGLLQRVRAEPGRQTTFSAFFWSENALFGKAFNAGTVSVGML